MKSGHPNNKPVFPLLLLLTALLLVFPEARALGADGQKTVLLAPFAVYASEDSGEIGKTAMDTLHAYLMEAEDLQVIDGRAFLPSGPGKPVDETDILALGKARGADFTITGSLSFFGRQISADATIRDLDSGGRIDHFVQGRNRENVPAVVRSLGEKIVLSLLPERKISEIRIRGNRKIESIAIQNALKSKKGMLFDRKRVSEDIKSIYAMGYFSNVEAAKETGPEGMTLIYAVEEKPLISEINLQGFDDISRGEIEAVMTIKTRQILDLDRLKADIEKIKALYHDKGYRNALVSYEIQETGKDIRVIVKITENEKLHIESITFRGNRVFTDKELKDLMSTSEKGFFSFITDSGLLKTDQLKEDVQKISGYYHNHGYIEATVGDPEITNDLEGIYIAIPITEGRQFKVGTVAIEGDTLSRPRQDLLDNLNISKKDYFDRQAVLKDVDTLEEICNNEGFAYAVVSPEIVTREKEERVDVVLRISKGIPVYFNRITIAGNSKTRDKVIRRELGFVEGEGYSRDKLQKSYMKLNQLRYFEEVNFQTEKGPDESLMDVNIQVKEMATGLFSIGAGYSATENAIFMAQVAQRNLFGRGQTLSLNAYFGSQTTNYELSFEEPWLFDMPLWSRLEAWNMEVDYDTYDLDTNGLGFTLGYPLFEYFKGYVEYKLSRNDVYNIENNASSYIKDQEGELTSSGVTLTLMRDTTDDWMFPSRGSKNSVSVEQTGTIFGGDAAYTKYILFSSWFFPLPLDNVFNIRGRLGYISPMDDKEVPVYERFYLGGISTLRGLRDVGPVDPVTGDVIGGLTMLNFNAEIVFPLVKSAGMKGVVFFDTGNAWESGYELGDMRKTAGVGIRWYSPVGPLRLEWGYVLDQKDDEPASRWEFTIGMFM